MREVWCIPGIPGLFLHVVMEAIEPYQGPPFVLPPGPHRFFRRLDTTGGADHLIEAQSFVLSGFAQVPFQH